MRYFVFILLFACSVCSAAAENHHGLLTKDDAEDMLRWNHSGFSLDGSVRIEANDREGLERLLRYCARPPFSGARLRFEKDGKLLYIPPKPGPRGKCLLSLTPMELIERLSQLIPPPRRHRHHYHGVLAPNSPLRAQVAKLATSQPKITRTECPETNEVEGEKRRPSSYSWAKLIARIYETMPLECPHSPSTSVTFQSSTGKRVRPGIRAFGAGSNARKG